MGRQENVEIFEDTLALCKQNSTLRNAIEQSTKKQKLYPEGIECAEKQAITYARPAQIIVSSKRTLEAAMPYAYAGKKVCIHNFASAANPGGGVGERFFGTGRGNLPLFHAVSESQRRKPLEAILRASSPPTEPAAQ